MGSKTEYLNLEGLRVDGRRPHEIRNIRFQLGLCERADGTCYFEQGNTKVIATVYGPHEVFPTLVVPGVCLAYTRAFDPKQIQILVQGLCH